MVRREWLSAEQFEDAIAATNLLPGPGSTQLAIFCAWRLRGIRGALVGGAGFVVPGLIAILGLAVLFLASAPPTWVVGAGAGAGAAVAAAAVQAGAGLIPASWKRARDTHPWRWALYGAAGLLATVLIGPWLDARARAFLDGAGPAAIGAILGSAIPLALALEEPWQLVVLALAAVALLWARRDVVTTLLGAATIGAVVGLAGGSLPG